MDPYRHIVSLAPANTEILYALDAEETIVATTSICNHPDGVQDKPSVGGWTNPDVDEVVKHDPDLVLASDELQNEAVAQCEDAGLEVLQLTPTAFHDVFNTVKQIGEIVGREAEARAVVDRMNEDAREAAVSTDDRTRVYCEEWHEPRMIGGNWIPRMVRIVGGTYPIDEGERSREISTSEVQAFDPEHIFIHYCGFGDAAESEEIADREGWEEITAVEEGNIHIIDDSLLNRPGPRLVKGMKTIRQKITA